ncbi:MAG TPA: sialidase family protein [Hanamia sp.]|nr:sialidase family protein [Hanamia sp.]
MKKLRILIALTFLIHGVSQSQTTTSKFPVVESTLIFPPQLLHTHGSTLVNLPNGDFLAAWFEGHGERTADDVKIMGARLKKGDASWSKPFVMADTYNIPDCNPVLFLNHQNKLFLVWIAVQANRWEYSILRFRTSIDYTKTGAPVWNWQDNILLKPDDRFAKEVKSKFKDLPPGKSAWAAYAPQYDNMIIEASKDEGKRSIGWMTRIKPLLLGENKILLPLYSDGFNFSLVAISNDDGTNWYPSLPIVGRGNVQPSLIQKKDGTIMAYMRDNGDEPSRVQISESNDSGMTWTAAQKTQIPNTASVQVLKLRDGKWAFIGNDIDDGRYQISLYLSDDEGKTWKWEIHLEKVEKGNGSFSYPCMLQASDGLLHITYSYQKKDRLESIKYVVVNPEFIPKS